MTLHTQFIAMIAMVVGGIYLGFSTETFRRIEVKWQARTVARYAFEILYWVVQTCLLFYVLYRVNQGEIRFVFILTCLLGYSMYIVFCQQWYVKRLEIILHVIKTIISWTIRCIDALIIQPFIWLIRTIYHSMRFLFTLLIKALYLISYPLFFLIKRYAPESFFKNISKMLATCSTIKGRLVLYVKKGLKKWR